MLKNTTICPEIIAQIPPQLLENHIFRILLKTFQRVTEIPVENFFGGKSSSDNSILSWKRRRDEALKTLKPFRGWSALSAISELEVRHPHRGLSPERGGSWHLRIYFLHIQNHEEVASSHLYVTSTFKAQDCNVKDSGQTGTFLLGRGPRWGGLSKFGRQHSVETWGMHLEHLNVSSRTAGIVEISNFQVLKDYTTLPVRRRMDFFWWLGSLPLR